MLGACRAGESLGQITAQGVDMARRATLMLLLMLVLGTAWGQYPFWTNYCNTSYLEDLAFTTTDIWCLGNSPLRINRASGQITQLTHANTPLPENRFTAVATDPAGNVWITPYSGGLLKYDGTDYTLYQPDFNYYEFTGIVTAGINDIWLSSYYGLVHFDGSAFIDVLGPPYFDFSSVEGLTLDALGRVWFVADYYMEPELYRGIFCWDGTNMTEYEGSPIPYPGEVTLAFDANNELWVGGWYFGLVHCAGDDWTYLNTQNSGLLSNEVLCLAFDAAGTLWAAGLDGISAFDGVTWTTYTAQNSAWGDRYPYAIEVADDQSVWFATDNGLVKIASGVLSTVDTSLGGYPDAGISSQALAPDGDWRFLAGGGIYRFNVGIWTRSELPVADFSARSILYDATGKLWVNGSLGLLCFDGTAWTHYTAQNSGLPNNVCKAMALDSTQRLWIGTLNGLACFDGSNWQVYTSANAPFPTNEFSLVRCDPQGRIWCTSVWTHDSWGGAAIWDGQNWTWLPIPEFGNYTYYIADIDFLGNAVYFSTGGGLAKLEADEWTFYTSANSNIPSGWLSSAATDSFGNLWLAGSGLARFNGSTWQNYRVSNSGLAYDTCSISQIDAADRIWISSGYWSYLSVFDYGQAVPVSDPSTPAISGLRAWPNPFRENLSLELDLERATEVEITVYNLRGQKVQGLTNGQRPAGKSLFTWDGKDSRGRSCPAGIYLVQTRQGGRAQTQRVLHLP